MKITFVIHSRYGIGGVISSTARLAAALADRHDVEVVSLHRDRDRADFPLDARVHAVDLLDWRPGAPDCAEDDPLTGRRPKLFPARDGARTSANSRLVETRLARHLAAARPDAVIATHPGIGIVLGHLDGDFLKIAQIHQASDTLGPDQRAGFERILHRLDALLSVSGEDADNLRGLFPRAHAEIDAIPNCLPPAPVPPSDRSADVVIAAGRLEHRKHYDRLIRAFARAAVDLPTWQLRIYGRGEERPRLARLIGELGMDDRVLLMGATSHMDVEWPKASLAVSASSTECLPMNLIEAMAAGVPVVATDCDFGPREVLTGGVDGLLVPVDDVDSLAEALSGLMGDQDRRDRMGAAARESARRYHPETIARRWEELLQRLLASRALPAQATWTAEADGDLTVAVAVTGGDEMELRCRSLDSKAAPEVGYPMLRAEGDSGTLWARVPADDTGLTEGDWALHVYEPRTHGSRRLRCQAYDNRALTRAAAPLPGSGFRHRLAFPDTDESVTLRVWDRPRHAEVTRVQGAPEAFTVSFALWGQTLGPTSLVRAVSRRDTTASFEIPLTRHDDRSATFVVAYERPAELRATAHDVWDLRLAVPGADMAPLALSRVLGDFPQVKQAYDYAPHLVETKAEPDSSTVRRLFGPPRDPDSPAVTRVRPFFTVLSTLAINAVALAPE